MRSWFELIGFNVVCALLCLALCPSLGAVWGSITSIIATAGLLAALEELFP